MAAHLNVAFLWHFHQPDYSHPEDGVPVLPWVRMHGVRGYTDMVALLEEQPAIHATLTLADLPFEIREGTPAGGRAATFLLPKEGVDLDQVHKDLLLQALERVRFNKTAAGKLLGLNRDQVRYWMRKYGIADPQASETTAP